MAINLSEAQLNGVLTREWQAWDARLGWLLAEIEGRPASELKKPLHGQHGLIEAGLVPLGLLMRPAVISPVRSGERRCGERT